MKVHLQDSVPRTPYCTPHYCSYCERCSSTSYCLDRTDPLRLIEDLNIFSIGARWKTMQSRIYSAGDKRFVSFTTSLMVSCLVYSSTLTMELIYSSEIPRLCQITYRYKREYGTFFIFLPSKVPKRLSGPQSPLFKGHYGVCLGRGRLKGPGLEVDQ
jgi:hypothetical protein